jgi:lysyl-tRNA synthetase class 2
MPEQNSTKKEAKKPEQNISFSSIETQRKIRIDKIKKLKEVGINPYTPYSFRDFKLGFIRFWFDFVHKFDFTKIEEDYKSIFTIHYFLEQVLFPQSLVEKLEEKIQLRHTVREMGLDPDGDEGEIEEEFDPELIKEARDLITTLAATPEDIRVEYLKELLLLESNSDVDEMDEEKEFKLAFGKNDTVTLTGRIKSKRVSGKIAFATVEDESLPQGFQFLIKKDELSTEKNIDFTHPALEYSDALDFSNFKTLIDEGDYVQATGRLEYSLRGEPSLFVEKIRILTKSLRPLPDKLDYENVEERYLNRVVDYKMNTKDEEGLSVREIVNLKNRYWQIWREEMEKEGFLEVECPIFEDIPGGADARPFTTFYNELDQEMYLRISLELPLKKLIAAGFEKVYEIGRIFRNEGASPQHLQEYTQIEWYWAYTDYHDAMNFIVRVYRRLAQEIIGNTIQTDYYGKQINWGDWCAESEASINGWELINGWPAIKYFDAIRYYSKNFYARGEVDLENKSYNELIETAAKHGIEVDHGIGYGNLLDKIYKKVARPFIQNPIFLYHQPVELEPLAKRDPNDPRFIHRWQVVAGTAELGKAFTELNDPLDQFERFEDQQAARDAGDEEAQFMNEDYVKALELGLPPLSGFGMSERLLSFMLGKHIKECVTFPHTRRIEENKIKETNRADAVILNDPKKPAWTKFNTVAHLNAAFAAKEKENLFALKTSQTKDGEELPMNITHAIMVKETDSQKLLWELKEKAEKAGLRVSVFTQDMQDSSDDKKVDDAHKSKNKSEIDLLGVLVYGKKSKVEKLTKNFSLVK